LKKAKKKNVCNLGSALISTLAEIKAILLQNQLYLITLLDFVDPRPSSKLTLGKAFETVKDELERMIEIIKNMVENSEKSDESRQEADLIRYIS